MYLLRMAQQAEPQHKKGPGAFVMLTRALFYLPPHHLRPLTDLFFSMEVIHSLTSMPLELSLQIFRSLDSLQDTTALAAVSRTMRQIWTEHAVSLYRQVAPKCIEGERHARALQLAISRNSDVTFRDILSIISRSKFVNTIIQQFEQKIVAKLSGNAFNYRYKNGRPKHLSVTERRRFIRTYYQLWSLIIKDEISWQANISQFSIKQIYLMREMCWIPLPIGDEPPSMEVLEHFPRWRPYNIEDRPGRLGSALRRAIKEYVERRNSVYCEEDPWIPRKETYKEGYAGFYLLWDHGKDDLRMFALARNRGFPVQEPSGYERVHFWAESSDEEDNVSKD